MDSLWGNIFRGIGKNSELATSILKDIPLFEGLKNRELVKVRNLMHKRNYRQDEVIFSQGVPGFGMYIIESGAVKIMHEPTGKVLAELKEGDFFGELSLLAETPRSAAAVAAVQSTLYGFFHSDLVSLVERNPKMGVKIALRLAAVIAKRLVSANEEMLELQAELDSMVIPNEPG